MAIKDDKLIFILKGSLYFSNDPSQLGPASSESRAGRSHPGLRDRSLGVKTPNIRRAQIAVWTQSTKRKPSLVDPPKEFGNELSAGDIMSFDRDTCDEIRWILSGCGGPSQRGVETRYKCVMGRER